MPFDPDAYLSSFDPDAYLGDATPAANPIAANETLNNGFMHNATPEDREAVTSILTPEEQDFELAKTYYDQKLGTNNPPEMVQAHIEYEYGEGATAQTANAGNAKAAKHQQKKLESGVSKWAELVQKNLDVPEAFARTMVAKLAIAPKMIEEGKQAKERIAQKLGLPAGSGSFVNMLRHITMPGPMSMIEQTAERMTSMIPEGGVEKLADIAFKQSEKAGELQQKYMSGVPLEKSIAAGDFETAGSDIAVAIGFEVPKLITQLALARISPALSMTYMGAGAAAEKRAELGDSEDEIRNLIQPYISLLLEVGTETYIGTGRIISRIDQGKVIKGFTNKLLTIGLDFLGGGASETAATVGGNIADRAFGDDVGAFTGALQSFLVGGIMDSSVSIASFTLGDATRTRKQNTDEQIDVIVEEAPIPAEQKPLMEEMLKNPTEQNTEAFNSWVPEETGEGLDGEVPEMKLGEGFAPKDEVDVVGEPVKVEQVVDSETTIPDQGKPFKFSYIRNTEKAPDVGGRFGQDIEPSGRYVQVGKAENVKSMPNFETGVVSFDNPLVIDWGEGYGQEGNWKNVLSERYSGKTGEELSKAIAADGFDGIVTVDRSGRTNYTSEIVDLTMYKPEEPAPATQQAPAEPAVVTPETAQQGDIVGITRAANNETRRALEASELTGTEYESWEDSAKNAVEKGLVDDADLIVADVKIKPRELSSDEIAALAIRKAQLVNEAEAAENAVLESQVNDDKQAEARATAELHIIEGKQIELTSAIDQASSKLGRALRSVAIAIDRKTYTVANVVTKMVKKKGDSLTKDELSKARDAVADYKKTDERVKQLEAEFDAKLEAEARKMAEEILKTTMAQRTTVQRRANAKKKRETGKAALKKLQWQVSDVTGVPVKVAQALKDIAVSHIMDGATTLEEVVKRVQKDVPDTRVTAKVIYDSMGGRVKAEAKKARSDAEAHVAELKSQARLKGQISDAMEGIFDPKRTTKPTSAEVKALRKDLKALKESVFKTEADEAKVQAIADRIDKINDMVDRAYRPVKKVVTKSKEIKEAEAKLKLANKELTAQDRLALLEELLRQDVVQPIKTAESSETTDRLEKLRARIAILEELRRKKSHKETIDERIDELTEEIETFTRSIKPKQREKSTYRADELKALEKQKRQQDQIADVLEAIRSRKVPAKVAKHVSEDVSGYEATKKALREQMRRETWYQDQMELRELGEVREDIAELDRRIKEGDFEGLITPKQERIIKNADLIAAKLERQRKAKLLNDMVRDIEPKTWRDWVSAVYELPRTTKLAFDVGHIGRQAGYVLTNPWNVNPFKFGYQSFRAFASQEYADLVDLMVAEDEYHADAIADGVHIIEDGQSLSETERVVMTGGLTERITDKMLPKKMLTKGLKASERSQKSMLNLLRTRLYSRFRRNNPDATIEERKAAASYFNAVTGYGTWKITDNIAKDKIAQKAFTSVRFTASRYQTATILLDPTKMKHKGLRKQMLQDAALFYGIRGLGLLALVSAVPDEWEWGVGTNPDHSTIGRILMKMDNGQTLVVDPWAGVQRTARVGRAIQAGDANALGAVLKDIEKSAHVTISAMRNVTFGKKYYNEDVDRYEAALRSIAPIPLESAVDSIMDDTPAGYVLLSSFLDLVGLGAYTVETKSLRNKTEWKDRNKKK